MKRFAELYAALDATTKSSEKIDAMTAYFRAAPAPDAAWAVSFLSGEKLKRAMPSAEMRRLAAEETGLPAWLVGECYDVVGDLSETIALLLPPPESPDPPPLHELVEAHTVPLRRMAATERDDLVRRTWRRLDDRQRFLWHKMMFGGLRVGVAKKNVVKALAAAADVPEAVMAHRLAGAFEPTPERYAALLDDADDAALRLNPYPFFLATPLGDPTDLDGDRSDWQVEWKYDGIRAQLIWREGVVSLWSRGDELITAAFPEIAAAATALPGGTVFDGELVAWEGEGPLPFSLLQRRLNRVRVEPMLFADVPVTFVAFDLLESEGADRRTAPLAERRRELETILAAAPTDAALCLAPLLDGADLVGHRDRARDLGFEGLMIKRTNSAYAVGRRRGDWWKWKTDPFSVDAVLVYAQRGHGRRAGLYTDYTFAAWEEERLVPFTRAYSGLTDDEFREVNRFIERNTLERTGPVRIVEPELVFELHFEGIQESDRHKCGLALRFPRMARWRKDKRPEDADRMVTLRNLLASEGRR